MKVEINLERLRKGFGSHGSLGKSGFVPMIRDAGDLKEVLEASFTDDGFISGMVTVRVLSLGHNKAVVSLHCDDKHDSVKRVLCAARHIGNIAT